MERLFWHRRLEDHLAAAMRPLIVVLGPTASGKTGFSIALAEQIASARIGGWEGAEIINADSRQLYRGMDIGTAKITPEEARGIPHHLLSGLDPREPVTIAWYQEHALAAIDDVLSRRRVPVLVGGSMLYISSIIDGLDPLPAADPVLRKRLQEEYASGGWQTMQQRLAEIDPESAASIDPRNGVYLIRALEIAETTGEPASAQKTQRGCPYDLLAFGLEWPADALTERINRRTAQMLRSGWAEEVAQLFAGGLLSDAPGMMSHGYREITEALSSSTIDAVKQDRALSEHIAAHTRRYAKRQRTWWRRNGRIVWLDGASL